MYDRKTIERCKIYTHIIFLLHLWRLCVNVSYIKSLAKQLYNFILYSEYVHPVTGSSITFSFCASQIVLWDYRLLLFESPRNLLRGSMLHFLRNFLNLSVGTSLNSYFLASRRYSLKKSAGCCNSPDWFKSLL